jgi:hypothetical protein
VVVVVVVVAVVVVVVVLVVSLGVVGVSIAVIVQGPVVKLNVNLAAVLACLRVFGVDDSFTVHHVVTHAVVVANLRCCGSSCY